MVGNTTYVQALKETLHYPAATGFLFSLAPDVSSDTFVVTLRGLKKSFSNSKCSNGGPSFIDYIQEEISNILISSAEYDLPDLLD